jgi:hypothetical protein
MATMEKRLNNVEKNLQVKQVPPKIFLLDGKDKEADDRLVAEHQQAIFVQLVKP